MESKGTAEQRSHRRLIAWQESMDIVQEIYKVTAGFPRVEQFGLTSQMRRAAISVPGNIAEGAARVTDKDFLNFLSISRGSLSELETQVLIAERLGYVADTETIMEKNTRTFRLINGLMNHLRNRKDSTPKSHSNRPLTPNS